MSHVPRFGALIACALLLVTSPASTFSAPQTDPLAWRDLSSLPALTEHLDEWLDAHTDLPRRKTPPRIQLIGGGWAASLQTAAQSFRSDKTRGLYDSGSETIYLVRPWNGRDPHDVSVLLHELVHHRQAMSGHWYCPGAQELPAYRIQDRWLNALGLESNVNWIAVVLEAGCTPRDIHPD